MWVSSTLPLFQLTWAVTSILMNYIDHWKYTSIFASLILTLWIHYLRIVRNFLEVHLYDIWSHKGVTTASKSYWSRTSTFNNLYPITGIRLVPFLFRIDCKYQCTFGLSCPPWRCTAFCQLWSNHLRHLLSCWWRFEGVLIGLRRFDWAKGWLLRSEFHWSGLSTSVWDFQGLGQRSATHANKIVYSDEILVLQITPSKSRKERWSLDNLHCASWNELAIASPLVPVWSHLDCSQMLQNADRS